jgi:hypothetical protein
MCTMRIFKTVGCIFVKCVGCSKSGAGSVAVVGFLGIAKIVGIFRTRLGFGSLAHFDIVVGCTEAGN